MRFKGATDDALWHDAKQSAAMLFAGGGVIALLCTIVFTLRVQMERPPEKASDYLFANPMSDPSRLTPAGRRYHGRALISVAVAAGAILLTWVVTRLP
jgi:hypothetical protein